MSSKQLSQIRVDELYALAKVTESQLSGKALKSDFNRYLWFYDQVTDILARALLDDEDKIIRLEVPMSDEEATYADRFLKYMLARNTEPVIKEMAQ